MQSVHRWLDGIHIPYLGISLAKLFDIYVEGLIKTPVIRQAAAVSWSVYIALFPFVLFLLSILPYLPHYEKLQFYVFNVALVSVIPHGIQSVVINYIQNVLVPNLKQISNFYTIIFTLLFGGIGTRSLINSFNLNTNQHRSVLREYGIGILIAVSFATLIVGSLLGIYYAEVIRKLFNPNENLSWLIRNLTKIISFFSFPIFYLIIVAVLYRVGCLQMRRLRETLPGAVLSTILFVLITFAFAIYVKNFARQNLWYGSLGSMLLVMIWVNLNVILILFGNQFNIAIKKEKFRKERWKLLDQEENPVEVSGLD